MVVHTDVLSTAQIQLTSANLPPAAASYLRDNGHVEVTLIFLAVLSARRHLSASRIISGDDILNVAQVQVLVHMHPNLSCESVLNYYVNKK